MEVGFGHDVMYSYIGQVSFRRGLNEVHTAFYDPTKPVTKPDPHSHLQQYFVDMFDINGKFVLTFLGQNMFALTDPPATDILNARLRAKFWGAQNIIYRPFVRYIVQSNFERKAGSPPVTVEELTLQYAERGIKALIESTRAFHGLKEQRFIITNVFGTAHA
jgi:hypothetical protein